MIGLGQAIDLIIQFAQTPGSRRVSDILRLSGYGVAVTVGVALLGALILLRH